MRVRASDLTPSAETLKSRSVTTSARIETWRTSPPVRPSNGDVVALSNAARSAADEAAEPAAADEERDALAGEPRVQRIGAGSAFLVDDADGDGRATNGAELFGARSGDGLAELAALDGDGWIDEGDAAWQRLRVWTPDARNALQGTGARDGGLPHRVGLAAHDAPARPGHRSRRRPQATTSSERPSGFASPLRDIAS